MSNKQSSVEWYIEKIRDLDYEHAKGIITLGVWSKRKNDLIEQAKAMHKEETESKYQEGRDIGKIEVLTSQSTKNASEYSQGYNKGFLAALEYMNSTIDNKIKLRKYEQ